jgi:Phage virion morphogenesis family
MGHLADRLGDLANVPARASRTVAFELEGFLAEEFDAGRDPYGDAWEPLAQATIDRGRTPPPLTDTGAMRHSVQVRPTRGSGVSVTLSHPAEDHQTGWSGPQGDGPARPILPDRGGLPEAWEHAIEDAVDRDVRKTVGR